MTTPGGVPNLPPGALTIETLAAALQDMTPTAMRDRAAERFPSIFNSSMGGNPTSDFTFLGLMTQLWGGFNSTIANADPADITGPEDLPGLLITFIEELPIIGPLIALIKSIIEGDFDLGDVITTIENIFNTLGSMLGATSTFDLSALLRVLIDLLLSLPELIIELVGWVIGSWFGTNLFSLLGNPNLDSDPALFNPIDEVLGLIQTVLFPTGRVFTQWNLTGGGFPLGVGLTAPFTLPGVLGASTGGLTAPFTLPGVLGGGGATSAAGPLQNFINNQKSFLSADFTADDFNLSTAVAQFISGTLTPSNMLAQLIGGKLPDGQSPSLLFGIMDALGGGAGSDTTDIVDRLQHLSSGTGLFDAGGLSNMSGIPAIGQGSITGLVGDLANRLQLGEWQSLLNTFKGGGGADLGDVDDRIKNLTPGTGLFDAQFLNNIGGIPPIPDPNVPGVGLTIDNIVSKLFGWTGSGFTHTDSADALEQQTNVVIANSAEVERLWAALNTVPPIIDDFSRSSTSSLGANWAETYTGTGRWGTDGNNAEWLTELGAGDSHNVNVWVGASASSATDYQTNTVTLGSGPTSFTVLNYYGGNTVVGRASSDGTSRIEFFHRANRYWELARFISGTKTVLASGIHTVTPGGGTTLTLVCGDKATTTPRHYTCKIGTVTVASGVYGDTTSSLGASFRRRGFGGDQNCAVLSSVFGKPGLVNQFIGQDTP